MSDKRGVAPDHDHAVLSHNQLFLISCFECFPMSEVQGYLAGKKTQPPGTLLWAYAKGPRGVLEGWASSYG